MTRTYKVLPERWADPAFRGRVIRYLRAQAGENPGMTVRLKVGRELRATFKNVSGRRLVTDLAPEDYSDLDSFFHGLGAKE